MKIRESIETIKVNNIINIYQIMITKGTDKEVRDKLVNELLKLQKQDGSWSVIDDDRCPSDIRVEYAYKPTYYSTAALIYADLQSEYDDTSKEKVALLKGLEFAKGRGLRGHGFKKTQELIEALKIYKDAKLYIWIKNNETLAKDFCNMIHKIIEGFRNGIMTGKTYSDWDRDFSKEFANEIREYEDALVTHVWYVAYGSNINKARFMKYINRCSDTTAPTEDMAKTIPYDIYFSGSSRLWGRKGVAYLDVAKEGKTWGRMYKITLKQFKEIQQMEGPGYSRCVTLGANENIPVYTFTSSSVYRDKKEPSIEYLNTIKEGLKETYQDISDLTLDLYLLKKGILNQDDYKVLNILRNSAHGVKLQSIVDAGLCKTRVKKSVKKLYELELLVQDRRSVRAGCDGLDMEAVVYTSGKKREMVDIMLLWE